MMGGAAGSGSEPEENTGDVAVIQMVTNMFSTMDSNDLKSLKAYLDSEESGIEKYTNAIEYSYRRGSPDLSLGRSGRPAGSPG